MEENANIYAVPIEPVNSEEVEKAIKSLNTGKAEDKEGLTAEHFQHALEEVVPIFTQITNDIFTELDIPDTFKSGVLTPVLKKDKDKRIPGNYRGIVVTSCFAKILEAILKDRIDGIFNTQQSKLQRGFTSNSSSLNAAFIITETINHHKEIGNPLIFVSLDAQKAFDTVNHEILFNKLYHYGIQGKFWLLLRNLYRRSCVNVRWMSFESSPSHLTFTHDLLYRFRRRSQNLPCIP